MHPPLTPHRHKDCLEVINALKNCHLEHNVAKFWGACNDQKLALDKCFREEKNTKRKANLAKAKEEQARLRAKEAARTASTTA